MLLFPITVLKTLVFLLGFASLSTPRPSLQPPQPREFQSISSPPGCPASTLGHQSSAIISLNFFFYVCFSFPSVIPIIYIFVSICWSVFLSIVSFSSLNIFNIVDFTSLTHNSNVWIPQGWFLSDFFPVNGLYFPISCMFVIFSLELDSTSILL